MKKISRTTLLLTLFALVLPATALDLSDLMNPDDVMLRRPAKKTQPKVELVTRTNVVTKTDYVTKTNTVTQTDYVTKTNVVMQTAYVTKTNTITKMDYVTNVVTQTDYVTKTNVVVEKVIDESEKKALEAQRNQAVRDAVVERSARENAEAARGAAERKAVAAQVAPSPARRIAAMEAKEDAAMFTRLLPRRIAESAFSKWSSTFSAIFAAFTPSSAMCSILTRLHEESAISEAEKNADRSTQITAPAIKRAVRLMRAHLLPSSSPLRRAFLLSRGRSGCASWRGP